MLSDMGIEEWNEDDDAIITNYVCPNCGAQYEVTDTPENEKIHYPYWNDENKL